MARNGHERRRARDRVEVTRVPMPEEAVKLAGLPAADRPDAFALALPDGASPDARAWHARLAAVAAPRWLAGLVGVRSMLAHALRLRTAGPVREENGPFAVISAGPDAVVTGQDDRHLDFRVVIQVVTDAPGRRELVLTTVVQPHNRTGRAHFALIRPFHLLIVPGILRRVVR